MVASIFIQMVYLMPLCLSGGYAKYALDPSAPGI
jgi:hypothetical protein